MSTTDPILIADIGGTNARFALVYQNPSQKTPGFHHTRSLEAAGFSDVYLAIDQYLSSQGIKKLGAICLAVAGAIVNEKVDFPNSHWSVECEQLRDRYKVQNAKLLNDWEAVAYCLASLRPTELSAMNSQLPSLEGNNFTVAALGPGSGLGMSGLLCRENQLVPIISEGGHVGFSPETKLQSKVLDYLQNKFCERVSRERLLSGPGLSNIHAALCKINGEENSDLKAADIAIKAFSQSDPLCQQTFELFFEILGQVAGDMVLAIGAHDGVFIGGGICQRYPQQLLASRFRQGFENKGRYREFMQSIPSCLITHSNPGLLGASVYANRQLTMA